MPDTGPRIGSLFSGTGQLDEAVKAMFGGEVVWHSQYEPPKDGKEDPHQYAAQILAHHYPNVPNLGDLTRINWWQVVAEHGPIDILTGGFPCQDVSSAGKRAGLTADSRSGLWAHMAHAIHVLQPRLVVIENVQGLLSAPADRGLGSDGEAMDDQAEASGTLRALGAVLGDLATIGFHAEWCRVAASEVGAPHPRKRIFIYAWPADADPADLGHERRRDARRWGHGPADSGQPAADTRSEGLEVRGIEPHRDERQAAERGRGEPAPDTDRGGFPGHGELPTGRNALRRGVRHDADRRHQAPADTASFGRGEGWSEPARLEGRPDVAERGGTAHADADSLRRRAKLLNLRPGQPDLDWGDYGPAIRRWEHILGRPAPWPTDALGRLSPVFSEWLMGYPDGWVTCVPGLTRGAMLRAIGNGVCPQQAGAATRLLHERAIKDALAFAA